ncbi:hypothetical protein [Octadecabacter ascidiaceicola]|uniref:Uncharacterized protein n=1 Tax=Octadecabacter ascidiaceicola TaxID=1655543 RepID=A0A238K5G2_9RHOB|nr:hypothetical protein [Octadecabacter ascidiaceicola]SMX38150.1 hypothetical protein OCA8868_01706 [Octadecabacter ascidiaceicola]
MAKRDSIDVVDEVTISPTPSRVWFVFFGVMFYPAVLWNKIRRRTFSKFEEALIAELCSKLPPDQTLILESQLREVNYVSHVCYKRKSEAILFKMRPWGPDLKRKKKFAFTDLTVILATLTILLDGKKCRVDFVCNRGIMSIIEFGIDIRGLSNLSEVEVTNVDTTPQALDDFGQALD